MRRSALAAAIAVVLVAGGVATGFGVQAWRGRCAAQFSVEDGGPLPTAYDGEDVGRATATRGGSTADDNLVARGRIARDALKAAGGSAGLGPLRWYRAFDTGEAQSPEEMRLLGHVGDAAVVGFGSRSDGRLVFVRPGDGREWRSLAVKGSLDSLARAGDDLVAAQTVDGSRVLGAFTAHGSRIWCTRLDAHGSAPRPTGLSAGAGGVALLEQDPGHAGRVTMLDTDGHERWHVAEPDSWQLQVKVWQGLVVESSDFTDAINTDGAPQQADDVTPTELVARDARSGSVRWRYRHAGPDGTLWPTMLLTTAGDVLVAYADRPATTSDDPAAGQAVVVGVDSSGKELWQRPAWRWLGTPAGDDGALSDDDIVVVPTAGQDVLTEISAVDPASGRVLWHRDTAVPATATSMPGVINAGELGSGAVADGRVLVPGRNLTVLDAATGRPVSVAGVRSDKAPNLELGVTRVVVGVGTVLVETAWGLFAYAAP